LQKANNNLFNHDISKTPVYIKPLSENALTENRQANRVLLREIIHTVSGKLRADFRGRTRED
jgi:hypothetical protein